MEELQHSVRKCSVIFNRFMFFILSSFFSSINVLVCFAYRLLAREGLNAEQLARDLKSFELKVNAPFTLI